MTDWSSRKAIRQTMRQRRRAISPDVAAYTAKQLAANVLSLSLVQTACHVAGYIANDSEVSPMWLTEKLLALGKSYYLPALDTQPANHLVFVRYQQGDVLKLNRYQIPQPDVAQGLSLAPEQLDIVLVPLVAFDQQGGRLGMGGGYYDRTFAFIKSATVKKPVLIGLAYDFQCVRQLKSEPWDVPLAMVVTERQVYQF